MPDTCWPKYWTSAAPFLLEYLLLALFSFPSILFLISESWWGSKARDRGLHRSNHEESKAAQPQSARLTSCGTTQLQVPTFTCHHQETNRGPHRKRVHQEIRYRQKKLRLFGVKQAVMWFHSTRTLALSAKTIWWTFLLSHMWVKIFSVLRAEFFTEIHSFFKSFLDRHLKDVYVLINQI